MKRTQTIMVCLLLLASFGTMAQELRFSNSIYIELEGTVSGNSSEVVGLATLIVPQGKTTKLTSISCGGTDQNGVPSISSAGSLFLNGVPVYGFSSALPQIPPIWLPAGQYQLELIGSGGSLTLKAFISGVEFNLE